MLLNSREFKFLKKYYRNVHRKLNAKHANIENVFLKVDRALSKLIFYLIEIKKNSTISLKVEVLLFLC